MANKIQGITSPGIVPKSVILSWKFSLPFKKLINIEENNKKEITPKKTPIINTPLVAFGFFFSYLLN